MEYRAASLWDKSLALIAVVALAAHQQQFPASIWTWTDDNIPWLPIPLLVAAGLFSLAPLTARADSQLTKRKTALQRLLLIRMGHVLTKLEHTIPGFDHGDLGLHIWRVEGRFFGLIRRRLERVSTYRLGGRSTLRDFHPRFGEGVAGLCWKYNREIAFDVSTLAARALTKEDFESIRANEGGDAVMNLSWDVFEDVKHRGAVAASPIRSKSGRFRGCVTIDISGGFSELEASGVMGDLNEMSELLSGHTYDEM